MDKVIRFFVVACVIFVAGSLNAQDRDGLDPKFQDLMESSETYDVYKVIRISRLNAFWAEALDSLAAGESEIKKLERELALTKEEVQVKDESITQLNSDLVALQSNVQNISFAGMDIPKGTYHIIVWLIIVGLLLAALWVGYLYKNSFALTDRAKKDFHELQKEYDAFRDKSREKEVKLKRELQTALNSLEDLKKVKR